VGVNKTKAGFTLIELMIAMMLGLIVIGGALSIYISTIKSSSDVVKSARLNYDLDSVMQLMVNDIRRAGYWGGAVAGSDATNNNFTQVPTVATATDIQIRNVAAPTTAVSEGNCILYTYDGANGDGVVDTNEYYGFRLNGVELEIRTTGTAATAGDCDGDGQWENIIDENKVEITDLQFSLSPIAAIVGPPAIPGLPKSSQCLNTTATVAVPFNEPCNGVNVPSTNTAIETRQVNIVLTGEVLNDTAVSKVLIGSVKVRNDRIFTQP